jgi:foldase protein PrsA
VRRALVLALALAAAGAVPAAAQERPVFTVTAPAGVHTTTRAELEHWVRIARAAGATRAEARVQAFQVLVNNAWLTGEAAERGLTVSDEAVARAFRAQLRQSFPNRRDFRKFLRDSRQTVADILVRIRVDLLTNRIRRQVVAGAAGTVTDAAVDAYLAEHGNETIPERRDVRIVVTKRRDEAMRATRALRGGATWKSVARRYSIDEATNGSGGRLPGLARGTLERALERAIFGTRPGRIGGPVKTQFGYYVFMVSRIHPAREMSAARSRAIVRQRLVARAEERTLDRFVTDFRAKWRSRTVCAPAFVGLPECGNSA